jgi:quercetin dioxygenase-like cupin family protein
MPKFSLATALDAIADPTQPNIFAHFDVNHMLGVVRIPAADGFWEQHDDGDELLVILGGKADFTIVRGEEKETLSVQAGDVLMIPRGAAHSGTIHEEMRILFLTPKTGNSGWTEDASVPRRHA